MNLRLLREMNNVLLPEQSREAVAERLATAFTLRLQEERHFPYNQSSANGHCRELRLRRVGICLWACPKDFSIKEDD